MIPFVVIGKIFLFIVPVVLLYLLRKMGSREQPKKRSHLSEFDKERIVEGEIVDESNSNR